MIGPLLKPKDMGRNYGHRLIPDERGVIVHPDQREVCDTRTKRGLAEYQRRREIMFVRQKGICTECNQPMMLDSCTFDHELPRGMGAAHRDDRIEINGEPFNSAVHLKCNFEKGSSR